jgi:hypothetical protein
MVELWCPLAVHRHVLIGHVLPLFVLALAGAVVGEGNAKIAPESVSAIPAAPTISSGLRPTLSMIHMARMVQTQLVVPRMTWAMRLALSSE